MSGNVYRITIVIVVDIQATNFAQKKNPMSNSKPNWGNAELNKPLLIPNSKYLRLLLKWQKKLLPTLDVQKHQKIASVFLITSKSTMILFF